MVKLASGIIEAARTSQRDWGVPACVTLGQFGLESAWGTRMPVGSFNPFGIKAVSGQPAVMALTTEVVRGQRIRLKQPFRKFSSWEEAFDSHGRLLNRPQYAQAMLIWTSLGELERYVQMLGRTYATDPRYASKLLSLIASSGLKQYNLPGHAKGLKV